MISYCHEASGGYYTVNIDGNPSRCDWVEKCGPVDNVKGVWQGVSKWCNMTDPAQNTVSN